MIYIGVDDLDLVDRLSGGRVDLTYGRYEMMFVYRFLALTFASAPWIYSEGHW